MALKQYRIHIYENDNYEVETKRRHLLALDLDTAHGLVIARCDIASARDAIAARRRLSDRDRERMRIAVHDALSDEYVMDWVG